MAGYSLPLTLTTSGHQLPRAERKARFQRGESSSPDLAPQSGPSIPKYRLDG
jgi:hypothetical protein